MKKIIYSKYSNDRSDEFNIVTNIYMDEFGKHVGKYPCNSKAKKHIENIEKSYYRLSSLYEEKGQMKFAKPTLKSDSVEIEWIEGNSFEHYLDSLILSGNVELCLESIDKYFSVFFRGKTIEDDISEINVDALFSNVIYADGVWIDYDYEWFVSEKIPVKFLVYRCLLYYLSADFRLILVEQGIFERFAISEEDKIKFIQYEEDFQRYTEGKHYPMWRLYQDMHGDSYDVKLHAEKMFKESRCQVYYDRGAGFCEKDSHIIVPWKKENNRCYVEIIVDKDVNIVRYDPAWCACEISNIVVQNEKEHSVDFMTNGYVLDDENILFLHDDPQIIIPVDENSERIMITYCITYISTFGNDCMKKIDCRYGRLEEVEKRFGEIEIGYKELKDLVDHLVKQQNELVEQRDQLIEQQNELVEQRNVLVREKDMYANQLQNAVVYNEELTTTLDNVYQSASWRITSPLRKIAGLWRIEK